MAAHSSGNPLPRLRAEAETVNPNLHGRSACKIRMPDLLYKEPHSQMEEGQSSLDKPKNGRQENAPYRESRR
jgi:hypothetical protein